VAVTDPLIRSAREHLVAARLDLVKAMLAAEQSDDFDVWAAALSARNDTNSAIYHISPDRLKEIGEVSRD
jgi:hypothetical protein